MRSAFVMLLLTVAQRAGGLLTITALARLLDPKGMGAYTFTINSSQSFQAMTRLGLDTALQVGLSGTPAEQHARRERIIGEALFISLGICAVTSVMMVILSSFIANTMFRAPELERYVLFSAIYIVGLVMGAYCYAVFAGVNAFGSYARISGFGALGLLIAVLVGAYFGGPMGAAAGLVAAQLATVLALFIAVHRTCAAMGVRLRVLTPGAEAKRMLSLGLPYYLGFVLLGPSEFFALGLLSQFNGAEGLGQLRVVQALMSVAQAIPLALSGPFITHLAERESAGMGKAALSDQVRFVWTGALLVANGIAALFPILIHLIFGEGYELAGAEGTLAMCAFPCMVVLATLQGALLAQRRSHPLFIIGAVQAGVIVVAAGYLMPRMGLGGYFLALALSSGIGAGVTWIAVYGFGREGSALPYWLGPLLAASALTIGMVMFAGLSQPVLALRLVGFTVAAAGVGAICWWGVFTRPERFRVTGSALRLKQIVAAELRRRAPN